MFHAFASSSSFSHYFDQITVIIHPIISIYVDNEYNKLGLSNNNVERKKHRKIVVNSSVIACYNYESYNKQYNLHNSSRKHKVYRKHSTVEVSNGRDILINNGQTLYESEEFFFKINFYESQLKYFISCIKNHITVFEELYDCFINSTHAALGDVDLCCQIEYRKVIDK